MTESVLRPAPADLVSAQQVVAADLEPVAASSPVSLLVKDLPEDRFLNREASWLDFNARVLALAEDPSAPLLERVKFAAIFASNLDEFFMVRVAGLKRRQATGLTVRSADGLATREQLALIGERTAELQQQHALMFADQLLPALAEAGITLTCWEQLPSAEQQRLHGYFRAQVFPVLTPLAVDPAHPFPYISGLSLNLAVVVRDPATGVEHFARVKVPAILPRFVRVGPRDGDGAADATARFLPLEELIAAHLSQLFPGLEVTEQHLFRVTRNADVEIEEDEAEDLLQALERELARRRFGPAVRLEVADNMGERVLDLLIRELEVHPRDVLRIPGLLDLSALWALVELDRPELKDEAYVPTLHPRLAGEDGMVAADLFAVLREGDVLLQHPYDSFATSVQRFIEQAAADPSVLAIKQTLYRTSGDSPLVEALIDAAEAGKQVVVLVEIKARFDEQNNITWARALERAGCHVVYGVVGLKTHCKTALVVRQEKGQLRRYAHIGTGNYNPKTARSYEDFGLLTADPDVGADLTDLFNALTGYSRQTEYRTLLVAPQRMRAGIVERIEQQAERARAGQPARVRMKVNNLVDEQVVDALYRAARAGVPIDCVVRSICALRPGVPGLSETVRVRSILGRYLEHSRLFAFGEEPEAQWWLGSADIMHRNLDRRVETLVRVSDPLLTDQLAGTFARAMDPATTSWHLDADGGWTRRGETDLHAAVAQQMSERHG
jgi:polyphosphate kinase